MSIPKEMPRATPAWNPVAGAVSVDAERISAAGYVLADHSRLLLAAQFRGVRQRLLETVSEERKSPVSLVAVSSAVPGEGKSFVSLNLALSFARDKRTRVTLIDYDLARPRTTALFNCDGKVGLTDAMSGSVSLAQAAYMTDSPNLSFMPIGSDPKSDVELLSSQAVDALVSSLRSIDEPHIFLFDCPPMLANEDAKHLAQRIDLTVMVVKADSTPRHWTVDALEKLGPRARTVLLLNHRTGSVAEEHYGYGSTLEAYLGSK